MIQPKMLYTNLKHIENSEEYYRIIQLHANLVIVCGRMDPNSISIYRIMEALSSKFTGISFFDLELDNPEWQKEDVLLSCNTSNAVPQIMYFKNGVPEFISDGIQSKIQIEYNLVNLYNQVLTHNN